MSNLNDTCDEISPRKDANVDINYIEGVFRLVRLNPGIIFDKLLKKCEMIKMKYYSYLYYHVLDVVSFF